MELSELGFQDHKATEIVTAHPRGGGKQDLETPHVTPGSVTGSWYDKLGLEALSLASSEKQTKFPALSEELQKVPDDHAPDTWSGL